MERSGFKWVVGAGHPLKAAAAAWREVAPLLQIEELEISEDANFSFDLLPMEQLAQPQAASETTAFVAFGPQFMNFRRFELMAMLKERGLKLPPLIAPGAVVAKDVRVSENVWIDSGAIIGTDCKLGYNCFIGARSVIGAGCALGNSIWIDSGVVVGDGCAIGANSIVGRGIFLNDGLEVGRGCVVDLPGRYTRNVIDRSFICNDFDSVLVIVGK
jgi:hypothetical protein